MPDHSCSVFVTAGQVTFEAPLAVITKVCRKCANCVAVQSEALPPMLYAMRAEYANKEGQRGHAGSRLRFKSNICFPARDQDAQRKGIDC